MIPRVAGSDAAPPTASEVLGDCGNALPLQPHHVLMGQHGTQRRLLPSERLGSATVTRDARHVDPRSEQHVGALGLELPGTEKESDVEWRSGPRLR